MEQLLDVARTAVSKIKKNPLSIELWNQVLAMEPTHHEALEQLEGLLEREKEGGRLAGVLRTLAEVEGDPTKKANYLVKLGSNYSDKLDDNASSIKAWEQLYQLDSENRRAQDALKKLYLAVGDMESLQEFYAKQDKWGRVHPRARARGRDRRGGASHYAPSSRSPILTRRGWTRPTRPPAPSSARCRSTTTTSPSPMPLIDLYEQAHDERHISVPLKIQLNHSEDPAQRQALLRRLAELAERISQDEALAFSYYRQAFTEDHTQADTREHLFRLGESIGAWTEQIESLRAAIEKYGTDPDSIPLRPSWPRSTRSARATSRRPSPPTRRSSRSTPRRRPRSPRSSGCTSRSAVRRTCSTSSAPSSRSPATTTTAARSRPASAASTSSSVTSTRPSPPTRPCSPPASRT